MTTGLPAGTKVCPGWTSEFSIEQGIDSEGNASSYSNKKASGEAVRYPCGRPPNGRKTDPQVIREASALCARCAKQKTKFDEEMGGRERRQKQALDQYNDLIDAYVVDVNDVVSELRLLHDVVKTIDALEVRSERPPHARRGEEGYVSWYHERRIPDDQKLDILRSLAGLPRERASLQRGFR